MTPRQRAYFDKARRALSTAQFSLKHGDVEAAVSRAYYAAFYAAAAALLSVGEAPKTHSGTHRRFHRHFVESGRLSSSLGKTLSYASDARYRADYEAFTVFDEAAAADLITDIKAFVQAVEEMLATGG